MKHKFQRTPPSQLEKIFITSMPSRVVSMGLIGTFSNEALILTEPFLKTYYTFLELVYHISSAG